MQRINEINSYKQNPIYKKAQKTFDPNELGLGPIDIQMDKKRKKFSDYLKQYGFRRLGGGSFGDTYEKQGYPWVFKIFNRDPAYLTYLKYCINHQSNPAVPKIKGKPIKINNDTYVIRMEKLQHIAMKERDQKLIKLMSYLAGIDNANHFNNMPDDILLFLQQNFPDILKILTDVSKFNYDFDLNSDNFMMRGNTVVLIDPLYPSEPNDNSDILNELIGYKSNPIYNKAKTLYASEKLLFRSNRIRQMAEFEHFLKQHGFKKIGFGSFGLAFEKQGYPWIFKIFTQDPAYLYYLKYAIANQSNPNVPKIKGKIIKINDNTYCVRMEKLTSIFNIKNCQKLLEIIGNYYDSDGDIEPKDLNILKRRYPGILKILIDMKNGPWPLDLHDGNIMARNNSTPVITDPIYDPKGMREGLLYELIGYKSNPIYNKSKELFDPNSIKNSFNGDDDNENKLHFQRDLRKNQFNKFTDYLKQHGFYKLGSGAFGVVYEKQGYPWVFKIFNRDPAYLTYLKYVLLNQNNPHLPKIKGKIIKINNDTYCVRMEKLESFDPYNSKKHSIVDLYNNLAVYSYNCMLSDKKEKLIKEYPKLVKIIDDLKKFNWGFDLHPGNFMLRGNTLVLTDPIYDESGLHEEVLNELTGYKQNHIYQTAKTMFSPNAIKQAHIVDYESGRMAQLTKFENYLRSNGFKNLGKGTYGIAFQKPGYPWVFKIFTEDDGFLYYIKWVMANQNNENVPKIKRPLIKINENTYAIRIEKLSRLISQDLSEDEWKLVDLLDKINYVNEISPEQMKWIKQNFPGIANILIELSKTNYKIDLCQKNIMMRGSTLVVIDPIFEYKKIYEQDGIINELTGYKEHPVYKAAQNRYKSGQIGIPSTRSGSLIKDLQQQGYKFEFNKSGTKGSVLKREGDPYVIKIFQRDPQYMKYLHYAITHQDNPHVPKIKGRPIKINDDTYAIRIEQLYPLNITDDEEKQILDSIYKTDKWAKFYLNKKLRTIDLSLYKLLTDLSDIYGPGAKPDFGSSPYSVDNIMQRDDGTVVIVDPAR